MANIKAFFAQILCQHATPQTVTGSPEQLFHASPQGQSLRWNDPAWLTSPVIVGAALNTQQAT